MYKIGWIFHQNMFVSKSSLGVHVIGFKNTAQNWSGSDDKRDITSSDNLEWVEGRIRFQDLLVNYGLDDIYNADETGLFFRLDPNQTLTTKSDTAKGFIQEGQRKDYSAIFVVMLLELEKFGMIG